MNNRQPVHTVCGGAHLFKADTAQKLGALALRALEQFAPDGATLASALGEPLVEAVYPRIVEKLRREPVEDFHLDFEDGYGNRSDAEEDGHAVSAAKEMLTGMKAGSLPPFIGIRIKPFTKEFRRRSLRTLTLFLETLGKGRPANFAVTLPKVTHPRQVVEIARRVRRFELMVETPEAVLSLPALLKAAKGRCVAVHFGAYDYTAALGITADHQQLLHPACDFARHMIQAACAGTGVRLSDGATNILPVGQDRAAIHRAWKLHYDHIQHSLVNGYYQGWDLHPAQLPTRYAAVYVFFRRGLDAAAKRLKNFEGRAAVTGGVFDDAATVQGLRNHFHRAVHCGAISEEELPESVKSV